MLVQESAFCFVVGCDYREAVAIQPEDFRYLPWILPLGGTDRNCPPAAWFLCHRFCIDSSLHYDLRKLSPSIRLAASRGEAYGYGNYPLGSRGVATTNVTRLHVLTGWSLKIKAI